jgi:hypothetical protein
LCDVWPRRQLQGDEVMAKKKMGEAQRSRPANARGTGPGDEGRAKIRAARDIASKSEGYDNEGTIYNLRNEGSRLLGQDYGRKAGDVGKKGYYANGGMVTTFGAGEPPASPASGRQQVSGKGFRGTF